MLAGHLSLKFNKIFDRSLFRYAAVILDMYWTRHGIHLSVNNTASVVLKKVLHILVSPIFDGKEILKKMVD